MPHNDAVRVHNVLQLIIQEEELWFDFPKTNHNIVDAIDQPDVIAGGSCALPILIFPTGTCVMVVMYVNI